MNGTKNINKIYFSQQFVLCVNGLKIVLWYEPSRNFWLSKLRNLAGKWQHRKFLRLLNSQKSKTGDLSIPKEIDKLFSENNFTIMT
jgi:hypothetical protein